MSINIKFEIKSDKFCGVLSISIHLQIRIVKCVFVCDGWMKVDASMFRCNVLFMLKHETFSKLTLSMVLTFSSHLLFVVSFVSLRIHFLSSSSMLRLPWMRPVVHFLSRIKKRIYFFCCVKRKINIKLYSNQSFVHKWMRIII
jgi:hypothetical protein